jgi:hypothetical protein
MKQWVVVALEYDEEGPQCKAGKNGEIIVDPAKLEIVNVYGPFKSKKDAEIDAQQCEEMGYTTYVRELESPDDDTEG